MASIDGVALNFQRVINLVTDAGFQPVQAYPSGDGWLVYVEGLYRKGRSTVDTVEKHLAKVGLALQRTGTEPRMGGKEAYYIVVVATPAEVEP